MKSKNLVVLIGHVGKDPELRYTSAGTAVAEFSMATSEQWKDKATGEKKERTDWHTIMAWSKLGELVGEYVKKGMPVCVQGSIRMESWEKEGKTNYRTKIQATDIMFLGSPGGSSGGESPSAAKPSVAKPEAKPEDNAFDDDIPF